MEIRVVNAAEPNKQPQKTNILLTTLAGGAAGYGLKWVFPVGLEEAEEFTRGDYYNSIARKATEARENELKEIKKLAKAKSENKAAVDIFTKMETSEAAKEKYRSAEPKLKEQIDNFIKRVESKAEIAAKREKLTQNFTIKKMREPHVFIVPGIVLGLVAGFVYNAIAKFNNN